MKVNQGATSPGAILAVLLCGFLTGSQLRAGPAGVDSAASTLETIAIDRGLCVVLGLPVAARADFVTDLAEKSSLVIYFQSPSREEVFAVREAALDAGFLGKRVFADSGDGRRIQLADNMAGAILVSARSRVRKSELMRVLHPEGKVLMDDERLIKPFPPGLESWSHPHHGPDNNKASRDELARAPYLTQFLAKPMFSSYPTLTVAAAGRFFKIFGPQAKRRYAAPAINTLVAMNGYNGILLWKRDLKKGFMSYRNTMIATPDVLYLADDESCKMLDARTGELTGQIVPPPEIAGGTVWKWMALKNGVLYALVGGSEGTLPEAAGRQSGWPAKPGDGDKYDVTTYDYHYPETAWGFGRAFFAIDLATGKILWHHQENDLADSRGVAMRGGRIYYYHPNKFLACLDATSGNLLWKNTRAEELSIIKHFPDVQSDSQWKKNGYFWSTPWLFMTCDDRVIYICSEAVEGLYAFSAADGRLLWKKGNDTGRKANFWENFRVLSCNGELYAWAARGSASTFAARLDPMTGEVIEQIPRMGACVQPTAAVDSVFSRSNSPASKTGTARWDLKTGNVDFITSVRPACTDGVIISDGLLYWTPWNCACSHDLLGIICLGPAGQFQFKAKADEARRLLTTGDNLHNVSRLEPRPGDWSNFGAVRRGKASANAPIPDRVSRKWTFTTESAKASRVPATPGGPFFFKAENMPTALTTAGDMVFFGAGDGLVRALDAATGKLLWKAYTGGEIHFPPAIADGRAYVGSSDGRVYVFEARTGRPLWRFRLAPEERKIMVYERLASTWPVAGGVVVQNGVVYAAAGMTPYDGVHLFALDAASGKLKWHNRSPGDQVGLSGPLGIDADKLSFHGGHVSTRPEFDIHTGKRNAGEDVATHRTAGLKILFPREAWDKGSLSPVPRNRLLAATKGIALAGNRALVAGAERASGDSALAAFEVQGGQLLWRHPLPSLPVKWGLARDAGGRIFVSLENGQVTCFVAKD